MSFFVAFRGMALAALSAPALASPLPLAQQVGDAEMIFEGIVSKVEYASSKPSDAKGRRYPHTFVTFDVARVFKGRAENPKQLTLRFLGGLSEGTRISLVAGHPLFEAGDRDVLFVRGNGLYVCPLVGCEHGRIRVIRDAVYSNAGNELRIVRGAELAYGPLRPLEEVSTRRVGKHVLRLAAQPLKSETPPPPDAPARPLGYREFGAWLERYVAGLGGPAKPSPVRSQSAERAFAFEIDRAPMRAIGGKP